MLLAIMKINTTELKWTAIRRRKLHDPLAQHHSHDNDLSISEESDKAETGLSSSRH